MTPNLALFASLGIGGLVGVGLYSFATGSPLIGSVAIGFAFAAAFFHLLATIDMAGGK